MSSSPDAGASANRLIVVDDEPEIGALIGRIARRAGYDAIVTNDPADFKHRVRSWRPTVVVMDLGMPDIDGIDLLTYLANEQVKARVLIISGFDQKILDVANRLGEARGLAMTGVLQKPIRAAELTAILKEIGRDVAKVSVGRLAEGLEKGELFLEYQPKIDLRAMRPVGVEALLRWRHDELGLVPPSTFVPLAEETDLIHRLTEWVIATALEQQREWAAAGIDLEVAVNVSARNIGGMDLTDLVARACGELSVKPDRLTLELTESAAMKDVVQMTDVLTRLRLKGVQLAIDDFGTGYSSLVQLQRLPFSELKIDRSFVRDCATSRDNRIIVTTTIDLAHNLGLKAVAEGVESQDALKLLIESRCDGAQGYHFSRPLGAAAVPAWLQTFQDAS